MAGTQVVLSDGSVLDGVSKATWELDVKKGVPVITLVIDGCMPDADLIGVLKKKG